MDMGSIIALAIVLGLFAAVVVRLVLRSRRGGGCIECKDEACAFHGTAHEPVPGEVLADGTKASCPAVGRALDVVDAKLGALNSERGSASAESANTMR